MPAYNGGIYRESTTLPLTQQPDPNLLWTERGKNTYFERKWRSRKQEPSSKDDRNKGRKKERKNPLFVFFFVMLLILFKRSRT